MLIHDHYKVFTQRKYSIIVSGTKKLLPANMFEVLENDIPINFSSHVPIHFLLGSPTGHATL